MFRFWITKILSSHDKILTKKKGGKISTFFNYKDIGRSRDTTPLGKRERESEHFHFLENMCGAQCGCAHCAGAHCAGAHRAVQIRR